MLSSRIQSDSSENEGESSMPGDYAPLRNRPAPATPPSAASSPRPMVPPRSRERPRPPVASPNRPQRRRRRRPQSTQRAVSPVRRQRRRRSRQRSLTPDVVIHQSRRHRRSSKRDRVMRIPLDNRPTLGLRGPPTRVLELERVRCRRRRQRHRRHSSSYDADHHAPPLPPPPQSNFIVANVVPNPCSPPKQAVPRPLPNLTPAMIESLPKQIVHLPPIHLPGSQADANTELHMVIFPAELINPNDGTLSVIQASPAANASAGVVGGSPPVTVPVQPQMINVPSNGTPLQNYLTTASGPFLQQLQDLVQRVTLSQAQPGSAPSNLAPTQPSSFMAPPSNVATNSFSNASSIPPNTTMNTGPYPSANIRPTNPFINRSPSTATNPRNITPYRLPNRTPFPSTSFQPRRMAPAASSETGPYRPANITPFTPLLNRSMGSSTQAFPARTGPTPYIPPSSQGSSGAISSYSDSLDNGSMNASTPPQSQAPYQSNNPAPRSILRNGTSNAQMNTTYTRLNPASVSSTCAIVRKKATFA